MSNADVHHGNAESNLDLLRARVQSARNYNDLSTDLAEAIRGARSVSIDSMVLGGERGSAILRIYSIATETEVRPGEKMAVTRSWYMNGETKDLTVEEFLQKEIKKTRRLWEVGTRGSARKSWFYEESDRALAAYMQVLRSYLGRKLNVDLNERHLTAEDVFKHVFADVFELQGIVIPSDPRDNFTDPKAVNIGNLAAAAVEARLADSSTKIRKRIAVDMYRNGETNIRRISKLTGLARDTIYKELESEN
ncbi:hypothetical protein Aple_009160 [Acrocarpospora pleiomorpha]|uniref:Uncharacterized protein n=1 Tax=Acrocarpospora pleiomorpha TaxID=90975 RepID=A0A5M3XEM7_9ACTN|nr:hypothetical protein [Acrocarpospora pleiomorpha]GES18021.1 hypothetical protein Aple_009160 [Acrocarpospora pleiomorpha]